MTDLELASKRYVALLGTTRNSPLTLNERLVYSHLVYQARFDSASKISWISFGTGLKWETVQACLLRLMGYGLVSQEENVYAAVEPCGDRWTWFALRKGHATLKWHKRFPFTKIFLPSDKSPLTDKQNAVYWYLAKEADKDGIVRGLSIRGASRLLSITPQTFSGALEVLRDHRLIRKTRKGSPVLLVQVFAMPLEFTLGKDSKPSVDLSPDEIVWEDDPVPHVIEVVETKKEPEPYDFEADASESAKPTKPVAKHKSMDYLLNGLGIDYKLS